MVRPPSQSLVSPCLPTSVPVLAGVSAFPRTCLPLSPSLSLIVSPHACLCWMVCPLSEALSPIVSPCLPACLPAVSQLVFLSWMVSTFPRPCRPAWLPACLPSCFPLDGASAFTFVGWCVSLSEAASPLSPSLSPILSPRLSSSTSCFLFPIVGWCVRLSEALSFFSLSLSQLFPFVGWCVLLPEALLALSPTFSPSLSSILSPSLSSSLSSFLFSFVGWCVRSLVSQLVSQLVPLFVSLCGGWSYFAFQLMLWTYWMHTSSVKLLACFETVWTRGLRMMSFFTFHFQPPMFSLHPSWQSYAIQILAPPSDVSFIVFRHLALQQSKRSREKKLL